MSNTSAVLLLLLMAGLACFFFVRSLGDTVPLERIVPSYDHIVNNPKPIKI